MVPTSARGPRRAAVPAAATTAHAIPAIQLHVHAMLPVGLPLLPARRVLLQVEKAFQPQVVAGGVGLVI